MLPWRANKILSISIEKIGMIHRLSYGFNKKSISLVIGILNRGNTLICLLSEQVPLHPLGE